MLRSNNMMAHLPVTDSTRPEAATHRQPEWTRPQLVAQVKFVEWTGEGRLRHAVFLGLRTDKAAKDVRRDP
jgi:bifunctional non-homologous end joining protein LigD